jgi:hypothetical protein
MTCCERAAGTAIAAWFANSATFFFGVQMALAFYFVNLQISRYRPTSRSNAIG